jgi:ACT domain-containing protein
MEFNNEKEWTAVKIVITVVGVDRTGIIAAVSQIMAENKVNILTINQVILDGIFNMAMIVDMDNSDITLDTLQDLLKQKGDALGVEIRAQNQAIFDAMHRVG